MGSWNETCGLTNLPICSGDPVVAIILVSRDEPFETGHCYADEAASPLLLPIRGIYDDYGGIEEPVIDDITSTLLQRLKFLDKTGNVVRDSNDTLIQKICNDELVLNEPCFYTETPTSRLCVQLYHADIYDAIINSTGARHPYNILSDGYDDTLFECWQKSITLWLTQNRARYQSTHDGIELVGNLHTLPTEIVFSYIEYFTVVCKEPTFDISTFATAVAKDMCFLTALNLLRKGFGINSGNGSQDFELELHRQIAEYTLAFCDKAKQNHDLTDNDLAETVWFYDLSEYIEADAQDDALDTADAILKEVGIDFDELTDID